MRYYDFLISTDANCINLLDGEVFLMRNKNYYYQLAMTIQQLQQQGKVVTVKQLPTTINRKRRSWL